MASVDDATKSVLGWARADSDVRLETEEVKAALEADGGPFPEDGEVKLLVCGNGNGVVPPGLIARWPHLDVLLDRELS